MPISRSSCDGSSFSLFWFCRNFHWWPGPRLGCQVLVVFWYLPGGPEQPVQLPPLIEAQAIRFVCRDSSQVFSSTQVCPSTKPNPPTTLTVRSNQIRGSQISSSCCRFRSFAWVVPGSNVLIGRERVAAALLIASAAACSSKASRADARMDETSCQLVSFLRHRRMGNDLSVFHQVAVDLHSLAKNSCSWGECPTFQPFWFSA